MAQIINLNQARKRRLGAMKKARADRNAAAAQVTKSARELSETQAASERRRLDGLKRADQEDTGADDR